MTEPQDTFDADEIAVIALAGRFPGSRNTEEFWQNLRRGVESITFFKDAELEAAGVGRDLLEHPAYIKARGVLEDYDRFDASFFGFNPREAEITDPQHRVFLESSWEVLENAGYNPETYEGRIGVYAGASFNSYSRHLLANRENIQTVGYRVMLGNDKDFLPTWTSYKLDLRGPSMSVQTACSTSLVAVHMACQSLLNGECDMALAGGVSIGAYQTAGYFYSEGGINSPDGHCRPFDAAARGTVSGNGVGLVVLKRLAEALDDGDCIHAVIKGSAVNNDGALKVGYTAPSVEGQTRVISEALAISGVDPETISYVEAHGTGTALGDPIEIAALSEAWGSPAERGQFCAIGSVKSNIGHLDAAAGVTGLIKVILALRHRQLPPSLHFEKPNPKLQIETTPYFVNDTLRDWKGDGQPLRAGVSSFGIGGTNAHLIVEEAPPTQPSGPSRPWQLLLISARTDTAVERKTAELAQHLQKLKDFSLADVAYTLKVGRKAFKRRHFVVCRNASDAVTALADGGQDGFPPQTTGGDPSVVFMFPGQGSQYLEMARQLVEEEPEFAALIDQCSQKLKPLLQIDLRDVLYPPPGIDKEEARQRLQQTFLAQPALFVIEYALARLLIGWGVVPKAMIGHSIGEFVAACLAGTLSLDDALALVAARGSIMQEMASGAMVAVSLAEEELLPLLGDELDLAAVNAPNRCVVSGTVAAIEVLERKLTAEKVPYRRLHTSHAFHSRMMQPIRNTFLEIVEGVELQPPKIPYLANVSGTWITAQQATDPAYWVEQMCRPVRFGNGFAELLEEEHRIFVEVGPGNTLGSLARQNPGAEKALAILSVLRHPREQQNDLGYLLKALGRLWTHGVEPDWKRFYAGQRRQRIPLPTYPFERQRYWLEKVSDEENSPELGGIFTNEALAANNPESTEESMPEVDAKINNAPSRRDTILQILTEIVEDLTGFQAETINVHVHFLEVGVDSLLLIQASQVIQGRFGVELSLIQLLEELSTLAILADYLDANMSAEVVLEPPAAALAPPGEPAVEPETEVKAEPAVATAAPALVPQPAPSPAVVPAAGTPVPEASGPEPRPPEAVSSPGPMMPPATLTPPQPGSGPAASERSWVVQRQLDLMARQLEFLQHGEAGRGQEPLPPSAGATVAEVPVAPSASVAPAAPQATPQAVPTNSQESDTGARAAGPFQPINTKPSDDLSPTQRDYLNSFIARYTERTRESKRWVDDNRPYLADSRGTVSFRRMWKELVYPLVADKSKDSKIWDVDGNEYIDIAMGFGLHLFGHSPDFVMEAIDRQLRTGIPLGPQAPLTGDVARLLCELTGLDRAIFCNSGTEAVIGALRAAKSYTRRDRIAVFTGSYHGWSDGTLGRRIFRGGEPVVLPRAPGVSPKTVEDLLLLDYDDPKSLEILEREGKELAAVLVEPVQSRRPDLQPREFLHRLREITHRTGAVLIFDEMVTGFRMHQGGAQAFFDVEADLATYGKLLAGGLPIGVVAGKSKFMDVFDGGMWQFGDDSYPRAEKTLFVGAFFKHPLTMAACSAILQRMKEEGPALQQRLSQTTADLVARLDHLFKNQEVPMHMVHCGPLFRFVPHPEFKYSELFFYHLVHEGIFYTQETGNCFLATSHTEEELERLVQAVARSIENLQRGEFLPKPTWSPPGGGGGSLGRQESGSVQARKTPGMPAETPRTFVVEPVQPAPEKPQARRRKLDFSLYFFGDYRAEYDSAKYDFLIEGAKYADKNGFHGIWIPERHFHSFGGFSPNPAVVGAALAQQTERLRINAGSIVAPLHDPIRIAEEWSVVDNLSRGRVGVAFASGWHANDFVLSPDAFDDRRRIMLEKIQTVQKLWRGETITRRDGAGNQFDVRLHPLPKQSAPPIWLTASHRETYLRAGAIDAGVLTNLQYQTLEEVAEKFTAYREARLQHGLVPEEGHVTLLVHTLIGQDHEEVREKARQPFYRYLRSSLSLLKNLQESRDREIDFNKVSEKDMEYLLGQAYERYLKTRALIGSSEGCTEMVDRMIEAGVDEIGCFVDFGVDTDSALAGLEDLCQLMQRYSTAAQDGDDRKETAPIQLSREATSPVTVDAEPGTKTEVALPGNGFPLTQTQRRLWVLAQLGPEVSRAYNESFRLHLKGPLQFEALRQALERLVTRHETLRLRFDADGEYQHIQPPEPVAVPFVDFSSLATAERQDALDQWLVQQAEEPFDLVRGSLYRFAVARLEERRHVLAMTLHHILVDGQSSGVLLRELRTLYAEAAGAAPSEQLPTVPLRVVLGEERQKEEPEKLQKAEAYWLRQFADGIPTAELPTDQPRPAFRGLNVARTSAEVGEETFQRLRGLSKQYGCTMYVTVLSVFQLLMHQLMEEDDLVVMVHATRPLAPELGAFIGFRVNLLPLRSRLSTDLTFAEFMQATRRTVIEGYEYQTFSLRNLQKKLNYRRDPSRFPFASIGFNFERGGTWAEFHDLEFFVETYPGGARAELFLNVLESSNGLRLECDYIPDLFTRQTIEGWLAHFVSLLDTFGGASDQPVTSAPLPALHKEPVSPSTPTVDAQHEGTGEATGLTKFQQLLWMGQKLAPTDPIFNLSFFCHIRQEVDRQHFERAVATLVDDVDILRTVVIEVDGTPRARVNDELEGTFEYVDFSQEADPRAQLLLWRVRRNRQCFALDTRMVDFALVKLAAEHFVIYFCYHHILGDAWMTKVVFGLLYELYEDSVAGRLDDRRELSPSFSRYLEHEQKYLRSPRAVDASRFWNERLALPLDRLQFYGRDVRRDTNHVERIYRDLGRETTVRLRELARDPRLFTKSEDITILNIISALAATFLHRVAGARRLALGTPFHNRRTEEFQRTVGLFVNILPLSFEVDGRATFMDLVHQAAEGFRELIPHSDYPLGNPSHRPAYDVELNYMPIPFPRFQGEQIDVEWLHPGFGNDLLVINAHDFSNRGILEFCFDFHCDVFSEEMRQRSPQHFFRLLESVLEDCEQPVHEIGLLLAPERQKLLYELNASTMTVPEEKSYIELFEDQVRKHPRRQAVTWGGMSLTYRQLNTAAEGLARQLMAFESAPEDLVAVLAVRGVGLLASMLAIWKTGCAYLPLDPLSPPDRVAALLKASGTRQVLVGEGFRELLSSALEDLAEEHRPRVLNLEEPTGHEPAARQWTRRPAAAELAYVLYTSGSTGVPKGVMIEHHGMVNHLFTKIVDLELTADDVLAQTSTQVFDISIWQFLAALLVGGKVCILSDEITHDPTRLLTAVEEQRVTVFETVPTMLGALLMDSVANTDLKLQLVRWLLVTGEALPPELCHNWRQRFPAVPLLNAYGPTECSDDVTHFPIHRPLPRNSRHTPIGRAVGNIQLYVVDPWAMPVPEGVAGELFAGGTGVGRGYLNDPRRTAEVFVPDPFGGRSGARLYKTGDRVCYLGDGVLEFHGRVDFQVKVRGFRIEPGEIETTLRRHSQIREAVVITREDEPNTKYLAAYIVPRSDTVPSISDLRQHLAESLPDYMVPAAFMTLNHLPLTTNGKVDRQALPQPDASRPELHGEFVAPDSAPERALAEVWSQLLGVEKVGVQDNFFELGGDSILSIQFVSRAKQLDFHFTPLDLFQHPTIAELLTIGDTRSAVVAEQGAVVGALPLLPIQSWFFERDLPDPHHWNQPVLLEVTERLRPGLVVGAVRQLIMHHDALRLRFESRGGQWRQTMAPPEASVPFASIDLTRLDEARQRQTLERATAALQTRLDLAAGPLFRVALFDLGVESTMRLFLIGHHLTVDGVSWRVMLEDFMTVYQQFEQRQAVALPAKTTSYKEWAQKLQEYASSSTLRGEMNYWASEARRQLEPLPRDLPRGVNTLASARSVYAFLEPEETQILLKQVPRVWQSSIQGVMMAAMLQAVVQWSGNRTLAVDLEGHGREEIFAGIDLSRTVGWFTTIYPMFFDLREASSRAEVVKQVSKTFGALPSRGIGYGVLLYLSEDPAIRERLRAQQRAEVSFNYLGQFDQAVSNASSFKPARESVGSAHSGRGERSHVFEINSMVVGGRLRLSWGYSQNFHQRSTAENLVAQYKEALQQLVAGCQPAESTPESMNAPEPVNAAEPGNESTIALGFEDFAWSESDVQEFAAAIEFSNSGNEVFEE